MMRPLRDANQIAGTKVVHGNFALSARNLAGIGLLPTAGLNVYDILRRDKLVLTTSAVKAIEERLS